MGTTVGAVAIAILGVWSLLRDVPVEGPVYSVGLLGLAVLFAAELAGKRRTAVWLRFVGGLVALGAILFVWLPVPL